VTFVTIQSFRQTYARSRPETGKSGYASPRLQLNNVAKLALVSSSTDFFTPSEMVRVIDLSSAHHALHEDNTDTRIKA
jgi:hypothetical protein